MRASDAERDQAVEALAGHAADGRLDLAELEERVAAALHARTQDELARLDGRPAGSASPSGGGGRTCGPTWR